MRSSHSATVRATSLTLSPLVAAHLQISLSPAKTARQHEADVSLLEHVGRAVADACLGYAPVGPYV